MPGKADPRLKYFVAISENKKRDVELKTAESKIDDLKKRMLSRYWKDKILIFDDMIRLNVRTPTYDGDPSVPANRSRNQTPMSNANSFNMGPMNIDSKLLSNRPVSLQKGKQSGRMEPVINIEGTDAVCYPSKEAKKGRKVDLNPRVLRRIEQCKALSDSIAAIHTSTEPRRIFEPVKFRENGSPVRRPKTTSNAKRSTRVLTQRRPETRAGVFSTNGDISTDANNDDGNMNSVERLTPSSEGGRPRTAWTSGPG